MNRWILAAVLLLLTACAGHRPQTAPCAELGPGGRLCLLPPSAFPPLRLTHLVTLDGPQGKQSFLGRLQVGPNAIHVGATSLFGPSLFSIGYDGTRISRQGGSEQLRPVYLLAVMEFILMRPEQRRSAVDGLEIRLTRDAGRCLLNHGVRVLCVAPAAADPRQGILRVRLPQADITMTLRPLADTSDRSVTP